MKMKRYFAPDARQALRALREEQGPDAVILSNRRVNGGVEIITAMDYEDAMVNSSLGNPNALPEVDPYNNEYNSNHSDENGDDLYSSNTSPAETAGTNKGSANEQVHNDSSGVLNKIQDELTGLRNIMEAPLMQFSWAETGRVQPLYASLLKQLMTLGLGSRLSQLIARKLANRGLSKHSWLESLNYLADLVPINNEDIISHGGTIALIGPTGVGKTTTIAKLAARFALKHGRRGVTLITMDNYRIGAHEQLRSYGRILGIPVHVASDSDELKSLLLEANEATAEHGLTLIDTAGMSQRDIRLTEQVSLLNVKGIDIKKYLVLSATGQMSLQEDVINGFAKISLDGCIVTKIDEAASLGEIISVLIQHKLPVTYVCDGQKVPDNLHRARGKLLVKEAVKLMRSLSKSLTDEELAYTFGGVANHANV